MPVEIISKRDGFRRCGMAHSIEPQVYPDDRFTPEELKRLQEEPMLMVREVEESTEEEAAGEEKAGSQPNGVITREFLETKTKRELVAIAEETGLADYLSERGICEPSELIKRKKAELIDFFLEEDFEFKG